MQYEGINDKVKARNAVQRALVKGLLPRLAGPWWTGLEIPCTDCGKRAFHYDHYKGYSKEHWLSVQPVCTRCHGRRTAHFNDRKRKLIAVYIEKAVKARTR